MRHPAAPIFKRHAPDRGSAGSAPTTRNAAPTRSFRNSKLPPILQNKLRDVRPAKERFGVGETMESLISQLEKQRQQERSLIASEFLNEPPPSQDLVQVSIMIQNVS